MGAILVCNPTVIIVEIGGVCLGDYESVVLAALFNVGFMVGTYVGIACITYTYACVYTTYVYTLYNLYTLHICTYILCNIHTHEDTYARYPSIHVSSRVYVCTYI